MISSISVYVTLGSFFIRDSTLETFSGVTVVEIRPQRSSSSNVLAPDMNCLNHLKTVALDRDWSQNRVFNFGTTLEKIFPGSSHKHHSWKIPSQKLNTAGGRPVTLTGHFVAWNKNGCTESSKNFGHKYYETDQWCNVNGKVMTSLVRLGCKT